MIARRIEIVDGTPLGVCEHAAGRYQERVCPAFDRRRALDHLERLARELGVFGERPDWVWHDDTRPGRWVTLGADVVLLIHGGIVVTVLTRGGLSPAGQAARARRRRARRTRAHYPGRQGRGETRAARSKRRGERAPGVDEAA